MKFFNFHCELYAMTQYNIFNNKHTSPLVAQIILIYFKLTITLRCPLLWSKSPKSKGKKKQKTTKNRKVTFDSTSFLSFVPGQQLESEAIHARLHFHLVSLRRLLRAQLLRPAVARLQLAHEPDRGTDCAHFKRRRPAPDRALPHQCRPILSWRVPRRPQDRHRPVSCSNI